MDGHCDRSSDGVLFKFSPAEAVRCKSESVPIRQWPEVYDLCHTFLHVARVKKPRAMLESHAILAWP